MAHRGCKGPRAQTRCIVDDPLATAHPSPAAARRLGRGAAKVQRLGPSDFTAPTRPGIPSEQIVWPRNAPDAWITISRVRCSRERRPGDIASSATACQLQFALPARSPAVIRFALRAKRMAEKSPIEWTDATWNPVTGCTKISAGCDFCYAERFSERFRGTLGHPFENGFDLTLRPERLEQPLAWRRPRMIFVNSMSDLFHKEVPKEFIERVFETMEKAHWHMFQVLTKRSSLMRNFIRSRYGRSIGPAHIWCGVSVEDGTKLSRVRH